MPPASPLPELLTVSAVAQALGTHHRTIRRWIRSGAFLKPIRVGKGLRWRSQDIQAWLDAQAAK